mgnify:CR=1 FL=1
MKILETQNANGQNLLAIPTSASTHLLVASDVQASTVTVPAGAKFVLFSATKDFLAGFGTTPTLPAAFPAAGGGANTTLQELNPTLRMINPGVVITVNAAVATESSTISVTFYG